MFSKEHTKIILFGFFFVLFFALGCWGYAIALPGDTVSDWVYYSLQLFALQPASKEFVVNIPLQISRFGAPFLLGSSTVGLFLFASGRRAREFWGYGLKDHVVVIGDNDLSIKQALQFQANTETKSVVLISDNLNEQVVEKLNQKGIQTFTLEEDTARTFRKLGIRSAAVVVLMIEDQEKAQALKRALLAELETQTRSSLLLVQGEAVAEDDSYATSLKGRLIGDVLKEVTNRPGVEVIYFDPYHLAAQKMLTAFGPHLLVKQTWGRESDHPHLVLFGLGNLATSWLKIAMANCHFQVDKKMRLTVFFDAKTEKEKAMVLKAQLAPKEMQNSRLSKVQACHQEHYEKVNEQGFLQMAASHATRYFDIHFEELNLEQINSDHLEDVFKSRLAKNEKAVVYICHDEDRSTLHVARVLGGSYSNFDAVVSKCVVCVQEEKNASRHLHSLKDNSDFMLVFPIEEALKGRAETMHVGFVEACARGLHLDYLNKFMTSEKYGLRSGFLWEHLSNEKKASNRNSVLHFFVKASLFGMDDLSRCDFDYLREQFKKHEDELARLEHQRWEAHHFVAGWRLGPRLDSAFQHPCLVPYSWLSKLQQDKDREQVVAVLNTCEQVMSGRIFV